MNEIYSRVCALINLDNIKHNMIEICSKVNSDVDVYAVIKADGYGHGAIALANEYESIDKVRGYGVAQAEEASVVILR